MLLSLWITCSDRAPCHPLGVFQVEDTKMSQLSSRRLIRDFSISSAPLHPVSYKCQVTGVAGGEYFSMACTFVSNLPFLQSLEPLPALPGGSPCYLAWALLKWAVHWRSQTVWWSTLTIEQYGLCFGCFPPLVLTPWKVASPYVHPMDLNNWKKLKTA